MSYRYVSNVSPQDRFDQLEILMDDGSSGILKRGVYYDLSATEVARASQYIVLVLSSEPADATPITIARLPVEGTLVEGDVPIWSEDNAAFVPGQAGGGGGSDASTTVKGISKLSIAPVSSTNPIAVGTNDVRVTGDQGAGTASIRTLGSGSAQAAAGTDSRFPTAGEKAALVGTAGTPGSANKYVTDTDPRMSGGTVPRTTGMWVDFFRLANDGTPVFSNYATTVSRFKYVIMNVNQRGHVASLKAQNTLVKCLAYQDIIYDAVLMSGTNYQNDCPSLISREEAEAPGWNPDWYVRSGGALVLNPFGSGGRLLRLHLPEIQAAAVVNAAYRARSGTADWDGIFGDDCNYNVPTIDIPYTTDLTWYQGALKPFIQSFSQGMHDNGLLHFPNMGNLGEYAILIELMPFIDGYLDEFWTRYGGGGWNGYWYDGLLAAEKVVSLGRGTVLLGTQGATNTDTTAMRSGLATALMIVDTVDPARVAWGFTGIDHTNEKWDAVFEYAIGPPTGARAWTGTAFDSGLIRYFSDGVAVTNPGYNPGAPNGNGAQRTGSINVTLTGGAYTGSGRTSVTSVTLAAGEGAVMTRD